MRVLLVSGWFLAVTGLWAPLVGLELYWNLFTWTPRTDAPAWALLLWVVVVLAGIWFLSRRTRDRYTRGVATLVCLALIALAIHTFPAERVRRGLLGRESPSPLWYRGGRVLVMTLPALFLAGHFLTQRRDAKGQRREAESGAGDSGSGEHQA